MKNKLLSVLLGLTLSLVFFACGGKKDSDIQADIDKQTAGMNIQGLTATVNEGVVTLTGIAYDEAGKAAAESSIKGIKGVKSVVNNVTIAPPPPPVAPVAITADDPLQKSVTDAIKDFPGVKAGVSDGVITLTGDINKPDLPRLMKALNTLKPKKIDNKLTIK